MSAFSSLTFFSFREHAIKHQWVAMSNPSSKNFNEITGYIKLSISVIGEGDEQVQLNEDPNKVESTEDAFILMPPQIKTVYHQVKFRLFRGEKFPKMDTFGSIDGYVKCKYLKQQLKTEWITQKSNVMDWNEEFWVGRFYLTMYADTRPNPNGS